MSFYLLENCYCLVRPDERLGYEESDIRLSTSSALYKVNEVKIIY